MSIKLQPLGDRVVVKATARESSHAQWYCTARDNKRKAPGGRNSGSWYWQNIGQRQTAAQSK